MFFSEDRQQLNAAKEQNYVAACKEEFEEKSVNDSNRRMAKNLTAWSYLPNAISLITAGFFVVYLLAAYTLWVKIVLGVLLLAVAGTVELGKRGLISEAGKRYFPTEKLPGLLLSGVAVLMLASMAASYIGGNKLVTENASLPPKEVNPQIDSLKAQLAHEMTVSESFRKTTWKGKITRAATKGMNASRAEQNRLNAKIDELEAQDVAAYQELLVGHNSKTMNFGIVLGIIAILADAALFFLLWTVKKLRYEIALLAVKTTQKAKAKAKKKKQVGANAAVNQSGRSIGYRPGSSGRGTSNQTSTPLLEKKEPEEEDEPEPERIVHQGGLKDGYTPFKIRRESSSKQTPLTDKETEEPEDRLELKPLPPIYRSEAAADVLELDDEKAPNGDRNGDRSAHARTRANGERSVIESDKIRECKHCRELFEYKHWNAQYCGDNCRRQAWEARTGKKIHRNRKK